MYRQEKSHLTHQVMGRISAYISDIDNCQEFSSTSQTKLERTMKMTECIHALLDHIKTNCISNNKDFIHKNQLVIDNNASGKTQYTFNWTPIHNARIISGTVKISFIVPDIDLLSFSNFKTDNIESLTNLVIDLITLSFSKTENTVEKNLYIIKTKEYDNLTEDIISSLKIDIETHCDLYKTTPTFLYLKHKDSIGHFHKHYSNYKVN